MINILINNSILKPILLYLLLKGIIDSDYIIKYRIKYNLLFKHKLVCK